jgi:hypothetical protein
LTEVGVVVGLDGAALHWHLPPDRSAGALPDSRTLWDVLWDRRAQLLGFAHSHPGSGWPGPSWTDVTTFAAIEAGLGRRLTWWITSADRVVDLRWAGPGPHDYAVTQLSDEGLSWLADLRRLSAGSPAPE